MADPRIKFPLNAKAVAVANQKVWAHDKELKGRLLTMSGKDKDDRDFWNQAYLDALKDIEKGAAAPHAEPPVAPAAPVVTPCTCPPVEVQINNTPAASDDLVGLKCEHPAHPSKVDCRIRATGAGTIRDIVLTNPDGRLRFPESGDTTKNITLPNDGSWVPFQISGELGSNAIGDAVIEAHCQTAAGTLLNTKPVTVFWFDQAEITVTPGGCYVLNVQTFAPPGHAVDHSAKARIRPAGVDCTAPQLTNLRVGIMQNLAKSVISKITWGSPTIKWEDKLPDGTKVADGTKVTVPATWCFSAGIPVDCNDADAFSSPLYDLPGGGHKTLDVHCLMQPVGCAGGGSATTYDTPANKGVRPTFTSPANTPAGVTVGTVTYTLVNTTYDADFVTWAVIFDTGTKKFCAIRERKWSVHVDSAGAGLQMASSAAADTAPTHDPVTSPFALDLVNSAANRSYTPAGTVDFKK